MEQINNETVLRRAIYYEPNGELLLNKAISFVVYAVLQGMSGKWWDWFEKILLIEYIFTHN